MSKFDKMVEVVRYFKNANMTATSLKAKPREEFKVAISFNTSLEDSDVDDELINSVITVFEIFER